MIQFSSKKILIPVDFSETSLLAITHGAFTAQLTKGDVYLLHVINSYYVAQNLFLPTIDMSSTKELEDKVASKLNDLAKDVSKKYGIKVDCIIKTGSPSTEIVDVAKEINASLIIMGTHGYSPMEELLIGSVAMKVLTKSHCPTMAMSSVADHKGYNKIVMPIDTSSHTRQKVNYTIQMAKEFSAAVHVVGLLGKDEQDEKAATEVILKQINDIAIKSGVQVHIELQTNVKNRATATVEFANAVNADLIVIMTDQDNEVSGIFLGPYAQQVIHKSKCPIVAITPVDYSGASSAGILGGTSGG
ncbi:MAG: universal stress protein [Sphingobacteriaceae bacterium]|nr:universal stress protein [Sphingobacteriaceae bacterium]